MYLREKPDRTLATLMHNLDSAPGTNVRTVNANVSVRIMDVGAPEVSVRPSGGDAIEVPLGATGLQALAGWLDVPKNFLVNADPQLQEHILNYLLHDSIASTTEGIFRVSDHGISEVRSPRQRVIDPRAYIETLQRVVAPDAQVVDFWNNNDEFHLDTVVPEGYDRAIGGDAEVGDLTCGGIRLTQNRKYNHAPELAGLLYRMQCTNGMHLAERDLVLDLRGQTVEEVLTAIEAAASTIMTRIERRIGEFYDLRNERVTAPEQALIRMAEEQGISDRVLTDLVRRVPTIVDDNHTTSMFDVINLITNQANEPSIARRAGSRLVLERAGGESVIDHAERCTHCQARVAV